jgi:hypothetical protein
LFYRLRSFVARGKLLTVGCNLIKALPEGQLQGLISRICLSGGIPDDILDIQQ